MLPIGIIETPSSAVKLAQNYFLEAKAEMRYEDGNKRAVLVLILDSSAKEVIIPQQILSKEFETDLINLSYNNLTGCKVYTLDPSRFCVHKDWAGWKEFSRRQYTDQELVTLLISYLKNPGSNNHLKDLGLHPSQFVSYAILEQSDRKLFFQLLRGVKSWSNSTQRDLVLKNFKAQYLCVFQAIANEMTAEDVKNEIRTSATSKRLYSTVLCQLQQKVIGQDEALKWMAMTLEDQAQQNEGVSHEVFLFVGPTGVGKTETAKAVASLKRNRFISLSCEKYTSEIATTKIVGSSPGYVGSQDQPHLVKEFWKYKPRKIEGDSSKTYYVLEDVVLLFDEFEKAHQAVKQCLLGLFDEGYLDVNYSESGKNINERYTLKNSFIICTSNHLQQQILMEYQKPNIRTKDIVDKFKRLNQDKPSKDSFSAELLGRSKVVPFGPIAKGPCYQRLLKMQWDTFLTKLQKKHELKKIDVENESELMTQCEQEWYGNGTDIRKMALEHFPKISKLISDYAPEWGNLKTKKLTFCLDEEGVYIRVSSYIELVQGYGDLSEKYYLNKG